MNILNNLFNNSLFNEYALDIVEDKNVYEIRVHKLTYDKTFNTTNLQLVRVVGCPTLNVVMEYISDFSLGVCVINKISFQEIKEREKNFLESFGLWDNSTNTALYSSIN